MPKKAISITLDEQNVFWLKARATARDGRGVSEIIDELVTAARASAPADTVRSVAGTIDIAADDPALQSADAVIRDIFDRSATRPFAVKEPAVQYRATSRKRRG